MANKLRRRKGEALIYMSEARNENGQVPGTVQKLYLSTTQNYKIRIHINKINFDRDQETIKGTALGALKRKKFKKSEITMEVGGWVQVSLGFVFGKIIPK